MRRAPFRPTRRVPRLERLEDRTLPSGNITLALDPVTGALVQAAPTASGNDTVTISGNGSSPSGGAPAFAIPGGITINAGDGNNVISITGGVDANNLTITGAGDGSNAITVNGVKVGASMIQTGAGADTVKLGNVVIGSSTIATGGGGDTVTVNNSPAQQPAPTLFPGVSRPAIGQLTVNTGNAQSGTSNNTNTVQIGTSSPANPGGVSLGIVKINEGSAANNVVSVNNATMMQGSITTGQAGSQTIDVSGDDITGSAGLAIVDGSGGAGVHDITISNDDFAGGALSINAGDGIPYWTIDSNGNLILNPSQESNLVISDVNGAGDVNVSVGNSFANLTLGDALALVAKSLNLSVGDNPLAINLNTLLSGDQTAVVGSASANGAPAFTITQTGADGGSMTWIVGNGFGSFSDSASAGKTQSITLGNGNGNVSVSGNVAGTRTINVGTGTGAIQIAGSTADQSSITIGDGHNTGSGITIGGTVGGNLSINLGNDNALNVAAAVAKDVTVGAKAGSSADNDNITVGSPSGTLTVGGNLFIGTPTAPLGKNSNVVVQAVNSANIDVHVGDTPGSLVILGDGTTGNATGDISITAGTGSDSPDAGVIYVANYLTRSTSIHTAPGGQYVMSLVNLLALLSLEAQLGSTTGANVVWAQSVNALFGTIDGGNSQASVYYDPGFPLDNSGFVLSGFVGYGYP
jgi:hypothetical protein